MRDYFEYLKTYEIGPIMIEMLLIGFVVWSVMRFLRGTGGEKLFRGLIVVLLGVWVLRIVSNNLELELERIQLLMKYFLVSVMVISTVAFQPEIRRGLIRLGGTRIGRSNFSESARAVENMVNAVAAMSRAHIGAIIAIEREVKLGDWMASGTILDAKVSVDLLNTIFWPGTPLHDMGVVVSNGMVKAAGVQFPLAEHGEYDRQLGSRHRAAIGLSKVTDAAIVVVSEETGNISLALNGKLARFLTVEQLRQQLIDLTVMPKQEKKEKKVKGKK